MTFFQSSEDQILAPYAIRSFRTRGRKHPEVEDPYRTPFQRDRDRIIHSKAFRRLRGKTQVFTTSYGDHYRSRLSHSIEVAQVSRDIARALRLNEDLCETIALAHDLGHTPFGHAGEEAMDEMMQSVGEHFEHNEQSLRVVEVLEFISPDFSGLNLTQETLQGLMKHRPVAHSLEAQLVDLADAIAYSHHDLDDGLRAGILSWGDLSRQLEIWRIAIEDISPKNLGEDLARKMVINRIMTICINDVIEHSAVLIREENLARPPEQNREKPFISFSPRTQPRIDALSEYLGQHFYLHPEVRSQAERGMVIIKTLFARFMKDGNILPRMIQEQLASEKKQVVIKDYIAGMTDDFAKSWYEKISEGL